jgi:hypothetical protein
MKRFKTALYLATIASSALATATQAQVALPAPGPNNGDNALHGTGATSIQNVLVQALNCNGDAQQLGLPTPEASGSFVTVPEPTDLPGPFNCATQEVQPNFVAKYVATGSGLGKQAWRTLGTGVNQFSAAGARNPFQLISGQPAWTSVQFAFADSQVVSSDLTAYSTDSDGAGPLLSGTATAGAAAQIPLYVLPVAVAYNPVYGTNASGQPMQFNVQSPVTLNGVNVGGLRMTRDLYCKVFNGEIVNFNDAAFTAANGGVPLHDVDPSDDNLTRWNADGVPIRLVGRMDRSGTTDIFTRALAAQCDPLVTTNKFDINAETLPYDPLSGVNFVTERPDTGLRPGGPTPAGTINSAGKEFFRSITSTTGTIDVSASSTGGAPSSSPVGNAGSGLFLVANGSGLVARAINATNATAGAGNDYVLNGANLNGKIGYIASDFIANSPSGSSTLHAAALQQGSSGSTFLVPSATNGTAAVSNVAPPDTNALGAWNTADSRNLPRENPLSWYSALYTGTNNLANPTVGYAITGTTQFLGYTCYKANNRGNIVKVLAENLGFLTQDSTGAAINTGFITGTGSPLGLLARSNIGAMPTVWRNVIRDTFLVRSTQDDAGVSGTQTLHSLNLYLQDNFVPGSGHTNATCTGLTGA